ncbi:hypothetical protein DUNSADRAFT_14790 [Dunaliella salina]|uniref:RWD domain-containing protein n=1 Tax=Dunaliella salina TaxID=3046 RepID=A0ABQ7G6Q1_DUNSA|nr:hypothetical protein DUNSADRAFT_14790 [Dunaliella salina]KAF5830284.1 hypothetical protein DUNSADRAFT_14790 [Dunaliella salina]|eukprot:KAF5830283.1 hypothetical protein DUNSADRAFT_14790 [Dunaliella salina]
MASPELQEELEALQWTYGEEVQASADDEEGCSSTGGVRTIQAKLFPNTGEREEQRFVEATLLLTGFSDSYPATAPRLEVRDARGLGDERKQQLQVVLERERDSLLGSMMIGQIIEAGREFLTANNHPEGRCAFCLEDMVSGAGACSQDEGCESGLVKLPFCYHAFHKSCFVGWWAWRQHSLMQKEKELVAHAGISSPESIIADQLPAKEEHAGWRATIFSTLCPCCRAEAPLFSLRHLDKAWRRLIFEKQRAAGGIIASDAATSGYSINSSSVVGVQQGALQPAAAEGKSGDDGAPKVKGPAAVAYSGKPQSGEVARGCRSGQAAGVPARTARSDSTGASAQQSNADRHCSAVDGAEPSLSLTVEPVKGLGAGGAAGSGCVRAPLPGWQGRRTGRGRHRNQGPRPDSQPAQGLIEAEAGRQAPTWPGQLAPYPQQLQQLSFGVSLQGLHVSDGFPHSKANQGQLPPAHLQDSLQQGRGDHAPVAIHTSNHIAVAANASNGALHQSPGPQILHATDGCHLPGAALPDIGRHQRGRGRRGGWQGRRGGRKQERGS